MRQPREIVSRTVRMPDVAGIELTNAWLMLRNGGFNLERVQVRYEESYRPHDEVIRQVPGQGALVAVDESVVLVVSRRSLLQYLPQVFQKSDRDGGHFLREFLWIFDHMYAQIERQLDQLHTYFDPLETPADFLGWLASWVALSIDRDWPEPKKRKLIQQALGVYRIRGTVRGLKLFLHLFTGVEPRVMENEWPYEGFRVGRTRIGLDSIVLPPVNLAHCFMVEVPAEFTDASDETILKIHDIIRMERPAHSAYYLTFAAAPSEDALQPFMIGLGRVGTADAGVVAGLRAQSSAAQSERVKPGQNFGEKPPSSPARVTSKSAPVEKAETLSPAPGKKSGRKSTSTTKAEATQPKKAGAQPSAKSKKKSSPAGGRDATKGSSRKSKGKKGSSTPPDETR